MNASGSTTLAITLTMQSLVAAAALMVPVLAPIMSDVVALRSELIGVYVALLYAGATLGSLMAGGWIVRLGAIRVSQWGLAFCALGLLSSLTGQAVLLAIGAVLIGLGYGPITPASSHLLIQTTPMHRIAFIFSVKQTGVPLGGVLAGLLAPKMNMVIGWRGALLLMALACLACIFLAQITRAALDADRSPQQHRSLRDLHTPLALIFSRRTLTLLAGLSFCFSAVQWSFGAYLVTYLYDDLSYTLVAAGAMLSLAQVAGVVGRLLWGWCADCYLGAVTMLAVLAVLMALGLCALAYLPVSTPQPVLAMALIVLGAAAVGWNGVYLAEVARQAPVGKAALATGGALAYTFLGVVFGPPLFGGVVALLGSYRLAFVLIVIPALLFSVLLVCHRRYFLTTSPRGKA